MATSVCLHGSAHDGLTGDSRACQRYIQIVVPIPFHIPIPTPVPIPIPIPIQSSFSQVALCLTEYPRFFLFLCLCHKCFPFPFPSLYLQCFFHTSISGYKHTTKCPCDFSSLYLLCCFTPEATYTAQTHKRRSRIASKTHDYPASFYCTLSDQTRTLIIIIIIIYPEILGAHLRTHAYTPGHIYPGKTRTRFCYPHPGAPARDHGAGRITPLGKSGFSSF